MKKIFSVLLAVCLLASCLLPAAAMTDITDAAVQQSVDTLQMLGVLTGYPDGTFRPTRGLSRAEFCTMAVKSMGLQNQLATYELRTIFPDVRSNHWARGYINIAVAGEKKIIAGMPDGRFLPEDPVTYGQAVTILLRMLGYTDSDAGMIWPQGYMTLAAKVGLSKSQKTGYEKLSRGEAATLFAALLTTEQKGGSVFAETLGTLTDRTVVLSVNETSGGAEVKTAQRTYETANGTFPKTAIGLMGKALLNEKGELMTFLPDSGLQKTVTLSRCNATWLTTADGTRYTIERDTPYYDASGTSSYFTAWVDLKAGDLLTLYLDGDLVTGVFRSGGTAEQAVVVRGTANAETFRELTGGASYEIFKNGSNVTFSDLKPYDVATYETGILRVNDSHITGYCEKMLPNEQSPLSVTLYGHDFPVLYGAMSELAQFHTGDEVTLLLTADGSVAGAVSPKSLKYDTVGIVTACSGEKASVKLIRSNLTIDSVRNPDSATDYTGCVVRLFRDAQDRTCLSRLSGTNAPGTFSVERRTIGSNTVSESCLLFDQVDDGPLTEITWEDIADLKTIPASKIGYCHLSGQTADVIILKNATGNCYLYGFLQEGTVTLSDGNESYVRPTLSVRNSSAPQGGTAYTYTVTDRLNLDQPGAIAPGTGTHASRIAMLQGGEQVLRSDFQKQADGSYRVRCAGKSYRVAADVQCCTAQKSWFSSLDEARGFSERLTIYRDPIAQVVRVVIAN
ncbi:MAG: S-layer homology domain-containing protein [Oscillospiraceae bacterium]|nr:S-layer homology domain-containing protein [Oscillospiraceae bacterium]